MGSILTSINIFKLIEMTGGSGQAALDVYVLSFGPDMPVDDLEVDLFTVTLDRLAYEFDVLFVVAAAGTRATIPHPPIEFSGPLT